MSVSEENGGRWALVAGAAEGLGAAFSRALARRGWSLVMADINGPELEKLSSRLIEETGIQTRILHLDLSAPDAWQRCMEETQPLDCRLLAYVAAYSNVTPFLRYTQEQLVRCLSVNTLTVIRLVHAFAGRLKQSGKPGDILLMASLSGIIAPPFVAPYAATKAFNIRLAEALYHELKPSGIRISACAAGIITTEKFWESRPVFGRFRPAVMTPDEVAVFALDHLGRKPVITPGWKNRLSYFFLMQVLPKKLALRLVTGTMQKLYPDRAIS